MAEHEAALLRYAERIVRDSSSAQDVVQNVFIKLFKAWPEGSHPTKQLRAWLYRVTHNEAVDLIRRESRLRRLHENGAAEADVLRCTGSGCASSESEKQAVVLDMLRDLHPREQQVVQLRLEEGLSYKEIGEIAGRSPGNVGNILHHAVRKLARRVQQLQMISA